MGTKYQLQRGKRITEYMNSSYEEKVRVEDLVSGDIIKHSICKGGLFVEKRSDGFRLIPILISESEFKLSWRDYAEYGLNCKMWVMRKVLARPSNLGVYEMVSMDS